MSKTHHESKSHKKTYIRRKLNTKKPRAATQSSKVNVPLPKPYVGSSVLSKPASSPFDLTGVNKAIDYQRSLENKQPNAASITPGQPGFFSSCVSKEDQDLWMKGHNEWIKNPYPNVEKFPVPGDDAYYSKCMTPAEKEGNKIAYNAAWQKRVEELPEIVRSNVLKEKLIPNVGVNPEDEAIKARLKKQNKEWMEEIDRQKQDMEKRGITPNIEPSEQYSPYKLPRITITDEYGNVIAVSKRKQSYRNRRRTYRKQ